MVVGGCEAHFIGVAQEAGLEKMLEAFRMESDRRGSERELSSTFSAARMYLPI